MPLVYSCTQTSSGLTGKPGSDRGWASRHLGYIEFSTMIWRTVSNWSRIAEMISTNGSPTKRTSAWASLIAKAISGGASLALIGTRTAPTLAAPTRI